MPGSLRLPWSITLISFLLLHLSCLAVFFVPFSWWAVGLMAILYLGRMFAVTAGYHRYFSHRAFRLSRGVQFLLAFAAQTSGQKGVLWWGAHHRDHHRYSDTEQDLHSPVTRGFWWSHVGWVLSRDYDAYDPGKIQDFARYPELRFLDRHHWICPWLLGTGVFSLGLVTGLGPWTALVWGFVLSTVLLFHGTFFINSLTHLWGTRRFDTPDQSRNNFLLALVTLGEGWHNNHHHFQAACRQGIRWWELDFTFYGLKLLSWVGLVRDLRPFPAGTSS
ncbi:MAG: fatty acid desaturase [Acidobacteria bacterium]|nr:fatty acid desaturase [Acidobacteriota bacterium]